MASTSTSDSSSLPSELVQPIADFDKAVKKLSEEVVIPLTSGGTRSEVFEGLTAAEKAKVDLTSTFAINSLVWMLLKTRGVDPRESEAKAEVARVRACIQRLKEVEVRQARPTRVDTEAAKRFVKSGLWMPDRKRQQGQEQTAEETQERNKKRARRGR